MPNVDADMLSHRLDEACQRAGASHAVTAEAAAQAYAPYLTSISQVRCRIITGPRQQNALNPEMAIHRSEARQRVRG